MNTQDNFDDRTLPVDFERIEKAFTQIEQLGTRLQDVRTQSVWFQNMLISLVSALLREYQSLKVGFKKSTPLLAWACRNMLELGIYTKFVLQSRSNAQAFSDDIWIDAVEIFQSFKDWQRVHEPDSDTPGLDEIIEHFQSKRTELGIERAGYLRMHQMAKLVNVSAEYQSMNKIVSKLVHPTAYSVLIHAFNSAPASDYLKPILFRTGGRYGLEAANDIKEYVQKNGVEPLP